MKPNLYVALVLIALGLYAPHASAQTFLGPRLGYDLEVEDPHIGVDLRFPLRSLNAPITLNIAADYFMIGDDTEYFGAGYDFDASLISFEANALYEFGIDNQMFTPYVGGGINVTRMAWEARILDEEVDDSDFDPGLNLIGGAVFGSGSLRPFAQARFKIGGDDLFSVMGGVLFRIN